ncbi:MAG: hypothetical protein JJU34_02065 [Lunatimonas sp.]|uniref:hypothetical protein n=1 Tax=Lunatimonas sp. TaxID=2060141 RepID=UPI00263AE681|nr:hypothetical protein [Lunatimonas sp.]MCC5936044.1 hypothetical protein [Lunatimonas sp.]
MTPNKSNDPMTPELIRLMKIFGAASLLLVLIMSFFNERRASNRGDTDEFSITSSSRLYFKNVRRAYYDTEIRADAKMELYRLGSRVSDSTALVLNSALIINKVKDAAYLILEPQGQLKTMDTLRIRWTEPSGLQRESAFGKGDRYAHFYFIEEIFPHLEESVPFEVKLGDAWEPILQDEKERDALRVTVKDFFRLIGRQ